MQVHAHTLYLSSIHAIKAQKRSRGIAALIFNPVTSGGQWLTSCSGCFTARKERQYPLNRRPYPSFHWHTTSCYCNSHCSYAVIRKCIYNKCFWIPDYLSLLILIWYKQPVCSQTQQMFVENIAAAVPALTMFCMALYNPIKLAPVSWRLIITFLCLQHGWYWICNYYIHTIQNAEALQPAQPQRQLSAWLSQQAFQTFSIKASSWLKHISHWKVLLMVVTWTHGVMKVYIQFRQHASSITFQLKFG